MVRFLLQTGMRQEEVVSLEWGQVDMKRRQVTLTRTKTGRARVVPLSDAAVGTLTGTARHISMPYVFWHGDGSRYVEFSSRFKALTRAAGVGFRCHDLRHLFAVDYLRHGGNIYVLQQILGHSSIKTTELYLAYLSPDEQHAAKFGPAQKPAQQRRFGEG